LVVFYFVLIYTRHRRRKSRYMLHWLRDNWRVARIFVLLLLAGISSLSLVLYDALFNQVSHKRLIKRKEYSFILQWKQANRPVGK